MRIGINILPIRKNLTGIGVYAKSLLNELSRLDVENQYFIFTQHESKDTFTFPNNPNFKTISFDWASGKGLKRLFFEHVVFPQVIKTYRLDLLHSVSNIKPFFYRGRSVVTIHDLRFLRIDKHENSLKKYYMKFFIPNTVKGSETIITDSIATKEDVLHFYGQLVKQVECIHLASSDEFRVMDAVTVREQLNKYGVNYKNYLLFVGQLDRLKNVFNLVKAFELFCQSNETLDLVLAGGKGSESETLRNYLSSSKIGSRVKLLGFVPDADLPALYNGSLFVTFVSRYEGFGFPILEATQCGVPVVTSNVSSMPEILESAALYANPDSIQEIADAIQRLAIDSTLRSNLTVSAREAATKFSWETTAIKTLKVYQKR